MGTLSPQILRYDSLPSTNLEAARQATKDAPEGLCIIAGEQTSGRGRQEREWVSPKGAGLYFSIILRPQFDQKVWPLLTMMAAIAVQDALQESCKLDTDIKWPNDILADDKKLCGILAETVETHSGRAVVVGIGINLTHDSFPIEIESTATSVEDTTGQKPDLEVVLQQLVQSLGSGYQGLGRPDGTIALLREWCARSSYCQDKRIQVTDGNQTFIGTTRGLETDGALRVEMDDGEIKIFRAGDVRKVRPAPL